MDSKNDPDLVLDSNGICNHCNNYDKAYALLPKGDAKKKKLDEILSKIKEEGKKKKYDCLMGVSGGVDSTYLTYIAKNLGLRPLIIHFDNGWNSELAVKNIENVLQKLKFNLLTYVIDWEEFKDIQSSYFKAGVVDIEFPTDHAIIAAMYTLAIKNDIKYILSGHNLATEGTYLPQSWVHSKLDYLNLKDIHNKYGEKNLKTFPNLSFSKKIYYHFFKKLEFIHLLDYISYDKKEAKKYLIEHLSWKDYGGKHYESIFTRFYQGYILPNKFGIDKRQFHYSSLICSGQMTREETLEEMKKPIYDESLLKVDKEFVLKKLGFTDKEFDLYMKAPIKKHNNYKTEEYIWNKYFRIVKMVKPFTKIFKKQSTHL